MRIISFICLFLITTAFAMSQQQESSSRGSIPEELLRPGHGESPRYPVDTVIGELGQGRASAAAYSYANSVAAALMSNRMAHPALSSIDPDLRENYLSTINKISPGNFRLGGGREEADGAVSFLVRFIGREYGMTGELYIRYVTRQIQINDDESTTVGSWVFEELILEEARDRVSEQEETLHRFDFSPYERFF